MKTKTILCSLLLALCANPVFAQSLCTENDNGEAELSFSYSTTAPTRLAYFYGLHYYNGIYASRANEKRKAYTLNTLPNDFEALKTAAIAYLQALGIDATNENFGEKIKEHSPYVEIRQYSVNNEFVYAASPYRASVDPFRAAVNYLDSNFEIIASEDRHYGGTASCGNPYDDNTPPLEDIKIKLEDFDLWQDKAEEAVDLNTAATLNVLAQQHPSIQLGQRVLSPIIQVTDQENRQLTISYSFSIAYLKDPNASSSDLLSGTVVLLLQYNDVNALFSLIKSTVLIN